MRASEVAAFMYNTHEEFNPQILGAGHMVLRQEFVVCGVDIIPLFVPSLLGFYKIHSI
jgi:hypothetical protein